ncbi:hypothetical protein [Eshraghiella crossota]|uniref:hypothetical protein n=1 Tax=Eshraghiella crossota TaxID=45851 RepID=UPI00402731EC
MTNREKYGKEILDLACDGYGFAMVGGEITKCINTNCAECVFCSSVIACRAKIAEWANSEYVESPVNWSKIKVDTPILVRDSEENAWTKRHFAKYEDNAVYAWGAGSTSWSVSTSRNIVGWKFAKLAESEE